MVKIEQRIANSRFDIVCDLVELPFHINFSAKPKIERLRSTHHPKAAGSLAVITPKIIDKEITWTN